MVSQQNQTENPPAASPDRPVSQGQAPERGYRPARRGAAHSKLRFFRTIFGVLVYAFAVLFLMALIILRSHPETVIIGAVLLVSIALFVATYLPRWRR